MLIQEPTWNKEGNKTDQAEEQDLLQHLMQTSTLK